MNRLNVSQMQSIESSMSNLWLVKERPSVSSQSWLFLSSHVAQVCHKEEQQHPDLHVPSLKVMRWRREDNQHPTDNCSGGWVRVLARAQVDDACAVETGAVVSRKPIRSQSCSLLTVV